jgi:hypothetical protein
MSYKIKRVLVRSISQKLKLKCSIQFARYNLHIKFIEYQIYLNFLYYFFQFLKDDLDLSCKNYFTIIFVSSLKYKFKFKKSFNLYDSDVVLYLEIR